MQDPNEEQIARLRQIHEMKPRKGAIILVIPILSVAVVGLAYVVMFSIFLGGRTADGARVTLQWSGCPAAGEVVSRRVEAMGLGDPELTTPDGRVVLTATLPAEPDVAARIPVTLAMPGVLRAWPEDDPSSTLFTNADVSQAAMRQDLTLMPWTVLTLTPEARQRLQDTVMAKRDGKVVYALDGQVIGTVSNLKGAALEVELTPEGTDDRDRMQKAAERTVVLGSGPLPCPLTPVGPS